MLVVDAVSSPAVDGLGAIWRLPLPREYGVAPTLSASTSSRAWSPSAIGSRASPASATARPGRDRGSMMLASPAFRDRRPPRHAAVGGLCRCSDGPRIDRIAVRMITSSQHRLDLELTGPVLDPRVSGGMAELACTLFAEIAQVICLPVAPRLDPTTAIGTAADSENAITTAGLAGAMILATAGAMRMAHTFAQASGAALGRPRYPHQAARRLTPAESVTGWRLRA